MKTKNNPFTRVQCFTLFLVFGLGLLVESPAFGQSFGRSVTSGNWFDNAWRINGVNLGRPGQFNTTDNVTIGDATASAGHIDPATVLLNNGTVQVESVTLGGAGATSIGTLNIQGTGDLAVNQDVNVLKGDLNLTGGSLQAASITADGVSSNVLIDGGNLDVGFVIAQSGASTTIASALTDVDLNFNALNGGSIEVNAATTAEVITVQGNSTGTVNATTILDQLSVLESNFIVDADVTTTGSGVFIRDGNFEQRSGVIDATRIDFLRDSMSGVGTQVQRTGGSFDVDDLRVQAATVDLNAADQIANDISVSDNGVINASSPLNLSGDVSIDNATLNLAGDLTANSLSIEGAGATLGRSAGERFTVNSLTLNDVANYVLQSPDTVNESLNITNTVFTTDQAFTGLGDLQLNTGSNATFTNAADFDFATMFGGAVSFQAPSDLSNLFLLASGNTIEVVQDVGQTEGLTIGSLLNFAGGSTFDLQFDSATGAIGDLDWALRIAGDQQALLQSYLDDGTITTSGAPGEMIGVVYDTGQFGDFTHIGFVTAVAVPEPSSFAAILLMSTAIVGLRRKRR